MRYDPMRRVIVTGCLLLVMLTLTVGRDDKDRSPRVRCSWYPPEQGSLPVQYALHFQEVGGSEGLDTIYVVEHRGGAERIEQEHFVLDAREGNHYRARVRARDALGRYGPWSGWSQDWWFEGRDP
jgi:hypothetical protein